MLSQTMHHMQVEGITVFIKLGCIMWDYLCSCHLSCCAYSCVFKCSLCWLHGWISLCCTSVQYLTVHLFLWCFSDCRPWNKWSNFSCVLTWRCLVCLQVQCQFTVYADGIWGGVLEVFTVTYWWSREKNPPWSSETCTQSGSY